MEELSLSELILINGGSQETYAKGVKDGENVRAFLDDLLFLVGVVGLLVIFK